MHVGAELDVAGVIEVAERQYVLSMHQKGQRELTSVLRYREMQPEYEQASLLSRVKTFRSRRLTACFRCGCHGLHVDVGRYKAQKVRREERHSLMCNHGVVEDEHHFLFDCPAYDPIRARFDAIFWPVPTMFSFFALHDPLVVGRFLRDCFQHSDCVLSSPSNVN